jgi:hypothetical protein
LDHYIQEDVWWRSMYFRGRTLQRKFKERILEELGAEAILVIH